MRRNAKGKTGHYTIVLSIITPHVELASMGKEPALSPFSEGIAAAIEKACALAHNAMGKPEGSMKITDAAEQVMVEAYRIVSDNGRLPANARQLFYVCRPLLMNLTGRMAEEVRAAYFTQQILPDYIDAHRDSYKWDITYDDRGHFAEPHTGRIVGLGTVAVREYLGERVAPPVQASINPGLMAVTVGPKNRYEDVLFVEKEGFNSLIAHAQIAERFDLAITSSKGMSNTALRQLLDGLVSLGMKRVFVLHDFDASGFSIFGTLATDSRRYKFANHVEAIDLGLRMSDVRQMNLPDEEYKPSYWNSRIETLQKHGASYEEIVFLATRRVELNAMTSAVFIDFLERKVIEHGVRKIVPDAEVLADHARHVMERALANNALEAIVAKARADAHLVPLPEYLEQQVANALEADPAQPWDLAVAEITTDAMDAAGDADEWDKWAAGVAADLDTLFGGEP